MPSPIKPIILIVDDTPANLQVLGNLLKQINCQIAVAMNGQQALDTVNKIKPDLILLDVMMPVMNGYEVCKKLKENEKTQDIPVIFLTAKTETTDIVEGLEIGAVDYITKPFVGSELLARVHTHLSLKATKEKLQEEIDTKNKFFSIISHDLRGSIGVSLSYSKILKENSQYLSEEEIKEIYNDLETSSQSTLDLLDNLLKWARLQSGVLQINPEIIHIDEIVNNNLKAIKDRASLKEITLKATIDNQNQVFADKNMVDLVIRNLLTNAIKFTPRGGEINIKTELNKKLLQVSIADNGVGIEPERVEKIFNVKQNSSTSGTEKEKGNGLGLILCKEFVEHNGGNIKAESILKQGTTMSFTLPIENKTILA